MNETKVKPNFHCLKLDETEHWAPHIVERANRIFGLYIFDINKHVHCCELTASYECIFVRSECEGELSDDLFDEIMEGDAQSDSVSYFHCSLLDKMSRIREGELRTGVFDLGIEDEENAIEFVQQNWV